MAGARTASQRGGIPRKGNDPHARTTAPKGRHAGWRQQDRPSGARPVETPVRLVRDDYSIKVYGLVDALFSGSQRPLPSGAGIGPFEGVTTSWVQVLAQVLRLSKQKVRWSAGCQSGRRGRVNNRVGVKSARKHSFSLPSEKQRIRSSEVVCSRNRHTTFPH